MKFRLFNKDIKRRKKFKKIECYRKYLHAVRSSLTLSSPSRINFIIKGYDSFLQDLYSKSAKSKSKQASRHISKRMQKFNELGLPTSILGPSFFNITEKEHLSANRALHYTGFEHHPCRIQNLCINSFSSHSVNRRYKLNRHFFKSFYRGECTRKGMFNYNRFPGLFRRV